MNLLTKIKEWFGWNLWKTDYQFNPHADPLPFEDEHNEGVEGQANPVIQLHRNRWENPYLPPKIVEEAKRDLDEWRLVIFDKVSHIAYELDIDHLQLFEQQVNDQGKDHPELILLDSYLKTVEMGMSRKHYHEDHPWFSFCFLTKQQDQSLSTTLCQYFKSLQVKPENWFKYYDVSIPQIRHSRVSNFKSQDRVYCQTLDDIFTDRSIHRSDVILEPIGRPEKMFRVEKPKQLRKQLRKYLKSYTVLPSMSKMGFVKTSEGGSIIYKLYTLDERIVKQLEDEIDTLKSQLPSVEILIAIPNEILTLKLG